MINPYVELKYYLERKARLPVGSFIYAKKSRKFPEGIIGKIIAFNTYESEYHITTKLDPIVSTSNPYILENEDGLKVTQDEFDNGEFVKYSDSIHINLEPDKYKLLKSVGRVVFLTALFGSILATGAYFNIGAMV